MLYAEVAGRALRCSFRHVAHFTFLIILFSAAAYKSEVGGGARMHAWQRCAASGGPSDGGIHVLGVGCSCLLAILAWRVLCHA